jgi:Ca2+-binding RTX toxin-like protein
VDFNGTNGVRIDGLGAGYSIVTYTATGYERIEINNDGGADATDGKFSVSHLSVESANAGTSVDMSFGIQLTDADGDFTTANLNVTVEPSALSGNDTITGSLNADTLYGGAGNDTISGLGGNDILIGGSGDDILSGGAGADRFVLTSGGGNDTITDFTVEAGGDVLDISDVLADAGISANAGNLGTYITFDTTTSLGNTIINVDVDGGGSGTPVQIAILQGTVTDLSTLLSNNQIDYTP